MSTFFNTNLHAMDLMVMGNMFMFFVIMGLVLNFVRLEVHPRIKAGTLRPLAAAALKRSIVMRYVFFSVSIPQWKRRCPMFILNMSIVIGIPLIVLWSVLCWGNVFVQEDGVRSCDVSRWGFVFYSLLWKLPCAQVVFTLNYFAIINDAQPELQALVADPPSECA